MTVQNVSEQGVRAYALRNAAESTPQDSKVCLLHNVQSPGKILQPGQSDVRSLWRRIPFDESPSAQEVSVDFVEYADGRTLGADVCQSMERLAGLRAGALAAKGKFTKTLEEGGGSALINFLKDGSTGLDSPQGYSSVWSEGFQDGARLLLERVKKANEEDGLPGAEHELRRPFDASGG